ncbi:nuclear factor 7, brain-like [Cheilinus undulatus]|uniref:nuclear factor 7, brain-like n=1 Tax=Cheilinus undulatus TaxID=241271 RepID=UPI001BD505A0|nr:nuclear factor 7, brain-like [Cheilinus undulatus]
MASEEDLCCPVCREVFRNPVFLFCSHSFCKDCVHRWWSHKTKRECPVCKTVFSGGNPPSNLVLKNLCEAFLLEKDRRASESLCCLHPEEKLKLFCLDHQEPVCLICRDSEKHHGHGFRPLGEAAQEPRKKLLETLENLKEKLKLSETVRVNLDEAKEHIQVQARHTEAHIKEQFQKLRQFLEEEEEARLSAVKEEEEQKTQRMTEVMEALSREVDALSEAVRATEEELRNDDVTFLQNYRAAEQRAEQRLLLEDPQLPPGALMDQAKHLGNLGFNIWIKMKDMVSYTPVILDPNTAGPNFILSEDLTYGRGEWGNKTPDNPERLAVPRCVLSSVGFDWGTHSWDVEVGDSEGWSLGVFAESGPRKGDIEAALWRIRLQKGQYRAYSPISPTVLLSLRDRLLRVRVKLDWTRGKLTFSDPDSNENLHTFRYPFTEKMFPFIGCTDKIKILPRKVQVTQKKDPAHSLVRR